MAKRKLYEEQALERHVKAFLDLLVLAILNGKPMYGYKIIAIVHKEFDVLLSPGSLYPLLHLLVENKLIESSFDEGKIVYTLTLDGNKTFQKLLKVYKMAMQKIEGFIKTNGGAPPLKD